MIDLDAVVRRLGGERSGDQVYCPAPGHSPRDRSLSVKFAKDGSFIVHSHAGDDWAACRDHIKSAIAGLTLSSTKQPARIVLPHENEKNLHRARHLWACRKQAAGSPVGVYLNSRAITTAMPASIGCLEPGAYPWPAMITAFGDTREKVRGIHLTFLKPDGSGKADIDRPKIMLGPSCSFPIIISEFNDLLGLAITEGIEDALSVYQATGMGVWAAGSAGRMAALATRVPGYIECVTIFAHGDDAGQKGAYELADALANLGVEVFITEAE